MTQIAYSAGETKLNGYLVHNSDIQGNGLASSSRTRGEDLMTLPDSRPKTLPKWDILPLQPTSMAFLPQ